MKNKLYSGELHEWSALTLAEQVECIRVHLCTGPCGQSSQVMTQRSRMDEVFKRILNRMPRGGGRREDEVGSQDRRPNPSEPGFYWALWLTAAPGTHEGDQLTPANDWEVVEVWRNYYTTPCEADACEQFGVSVPGVRESQWLENFRWGERVKDKA